MTTLFPEPCVAAAGEMIAACKAAGLQVVTAESCTGGLIAACLTEIAGASAVIERGYVVYNNQAKIEMLGVRESTLVAHGAVSEATAREMAAGALARSGCQIAVAVTGIAGPDGGSAEKPVGLVHLAAARQGGLLLHQREVFGGDRSAIRLATVAAALRLARRAVSLP